MTKPQLMAVQKAVFRHWRMTAMLNGMKVPVQQTGSPQMSVDDEERVKNTRALEARVKALKKATGRKVFNLFEVT